MRYEVDGQKFIGPYAEQYCQFVSYKRALGYKYDTNIIIDLREINRNIEKLRTSEKETLPQNLVMKWTEKKPNESDGTRKKRLALMRQLGLFISATDEQSFVLPKKFIPAKTPRYLPYIFTLEEIRLLTNYFDSLQYDKRFPKRTLIYPALFRTVYGCGLRIREALDLKVWEVDITNGVLSINNAKGGKSRYVPMSDSLLEYFCTYWQEMNFDFAEPDDPVFPSGSSRQFFTSSAIRHVFKTAYLEMKIFDEKGKTPRVHDLRHTFACHSIDQSIKRGEDPQVMLPILSTYMGHSNITDTEYYLHLTEEGRRFIVEKAQGSANIVFPEVKQ